MHLALPEMIKRKQGRVLNVVSMAAFQPCPFLATYGASKAFLQSFSEAVNSELKGTGVIVSTINPNNVDTPLCAKLPQNILLMKTNPPMRPEVVADKAVDTFKRGKKICVPTAQDWITTFVLPRFSPRSLVNFVSYTLIKPRK
jgi:short-subunit dehydrogenase